MTYVQSTHTPRRQSKPKKHDYEKVAKKIMDAINLEYPEVCNQNEPTTNKPIAVYIAGPMRGYKHFNFPAFDAMQDELSAFGYEIYNPATMDREAGFDPMELPEDFDWEDGICSIPFSMSDAIKRDIAAINKCQYIVMLRGWKKSKGARAEKAMAEWMGLEVRYQEEGDEIQDDEPCNPSGKEEEDETVVTKLSGSQIAKIADIWSIITDERHDVEHVTSFLSVVNAVTYKG